MLPLRRLPPLPLLLGVFAVAAPLCAQETTPYTIVRLDLNTRIARGTLPFKEPFYLTGAAPPGSQAILVRFRSGNGRDSVDCQVASGWNTAPSWLRAETADTFYVHMPELQPNRRFDICVTSTVRPVGDALTAFRREAARLLDVRLRELENAGRPLPNPLPGEQLRQIKVAFVKTLAANTGRRVLPGPPGTLFDTLTSNLPAGHANVLRDIVFQQLQRRDRIDALTRQGILAERAAREPGSPLQQVVGNERLGSLAAAMDPHKPPPGISPETFGRALAVALSLRAANPSTLPEAVRGEVKADLAAPSASGLSPVSLDAVWSPEDLEQRAGNLDFSAQSVHALAATVVAVAENPDLLRIAGWTAVDAREISTGLSDLAAIFDSQVASVAELRFAVRERARLIESAAQTASSEAQREVSLEGSSVIEYQARAKSLVSADLGLATVYGIGVVPYFGVNFYFEPVNKAVPLRFHGTAGDRFSLTLGVTAQSLEQSGERDDLFGTFDLLLGAGYRFADPLRLSGGAVFLRENNDDPLRSSKPVRVSPFVSLSLDWDVRTTLGKIADKLF